MKFDTYSDPSHGWVKVTRKKLESLGISHKISTCSYQRNNHVYLEEDSDLSIFMDAMKASGKTVEFREHTTNKRSRLRNYDCYIDTNVNVIPKDAFAGIMTPKKTVRTGKSCLIDGVRVYVGDWVGFKCDIEQSGKIKDISGSQLLLTSDRFEGGYIGGDTEHWEDIDRCWVD